MIISLRGTNGAGKSTLVREVMKQKQYQIHTALWAEGRRKPIGYLLNGLYAARPLFIPGHYEIANGGIDTLPSIDYAYELINQHTPECHVLYEGKNMSDGITRFMQWKPEEAVVVVIDHAVEDCIASVRKRGHSIKEESIRRIANKVQSNAHAFERAGYSVHKLSREKALEKVLEILST